MQVDASQNREAKIYRSAMGTLVVVLIGLGVLQLMGLIRI